MEFETIRVLKRPDGVGLITLDRPEKRNAISIRMRQEISDCLSMVQSDDEIGALIITGAGNCFSAGFDLDEFQQPERFEELFETSARYHRDLWSFPKPIIAAVNGSAMGGGFDLAALCDIRICSEHAQFGHPEVKFGAPPLFTPLRWIVGDGVARDLCLTGRRIDASEALRIGLVSSVQVAANLLEQAGMLAQSILEAPTATLQFAKRCFTENAGKGFEESFRIEHDQAFREIILKHPKLGAH